MDLYALINSLIESIITTFVDHYPTDQEESAKDYPYAEINSPNISPNNSFSDKNNLTIDIWDDKDTDITEIEGLTDAIHKALNRFQYNDSTIQVSINRDTPYRLKLVDPVLYIQRRQLRYIVTVYKI
jgi:hypothetical protein